VVAAAAAGVKKRRGVGIGIGIVGVARQVSREGQMDR
jgi:hypothetical protein